MLQHHILHRYQQHHRGTIAMSPEHQRQEQHRGKFRQQAATRRSRRSASQHQCGPQPKQVERTRSAAQNAAAQCHAQHFARMQDAALYSYCLDLIEIRFHCPSTERERERVYFTITT